MFGAKQESYRCQSCGTSFDADPKAEAIRCPDCGQSTVRRVPAARESNYPVVPLVVLVLLLIAQATVKPALAGAMDQQLITTPATLVLCMIWLILSNFVLRSDIGSLPIATLKIAIILFLGQTIDVTAFELVSRYPLAILVVYVLTPVLMMALAFQYFDFNLFEGVISIALTFVLGYAVATIPGLESVLAGIEWRIPFVFD